MCVIALTVDIEDPAGNGTSVGHGLDELGSAHLVILQCHGDSFASLDGYHMNLGVEHPVGLGCTLVYFLYEVGTREQTDGHLTCVVSGKGRTGDLLGAIGISIDIELPPCQVFTGVGALLDLCVTEMGIGEGDLSHITCSDSNLADRGIVSPIRVLVRLIDLLHPVGTGSKLYLDRAVIAGSKGRAVDQSGAGLICIDVELPSCQVLTGAGLLHDLGIAKMLVIEGHRTGIACGDSQLPGGSIKLPVGTLAGLIDFFHPVRAGQQPGRNQALRIGRKGRTGNQFGASLVCVDIELPAVQGAAGIGLLDDLTVTVMGIIEGHRAGFTSLDHDLTGGGVIIPQRILAGLVHFLDIVGAGSKLDGDHTTGIGRKGRTGNEFGAVDIGVNIKLPTAQTPAGIGLLHDLSVACLVVREGHGLGGACFDFEGPNGGIKCPVRILGAFIHFLHIVSAGQQVHHNRTCGVSGKGRSGYLLGQGSIGVDIELPAA